jgi:hypothetical protein
VSLAAWAEETARNLLEVPLPRRWRHTRGVAARARGLAPALSGDDADLVEAAAWLHDIGYSPSLAGADFHPLDGARYLRSTGQANELLCRLVAHHSCAIIEAEERGLGGILLDEFPLPSPELLEALTYCDMTTSPDGKPVGVHERLAEIKARYGPGHIVTRSITRSSPAIAATVSHVEQRLGNCASQGGARRDHSDSD